MFLIFRTLDVRALLHPSAKEDIFCTEKPPETIIPKSNSTSIMPLPHLSPAMADGLRSLGISSFFVCCSVTLKFFTKAVVGDDVYAFGYPGVLMVGQMALTLFFVGIVRVALWLLRSSNSSSTSTSSALKTTWREHLRFGPASACFGAHALLTLFALRGMSVPMFSAVKQCVPLVSLVLGVFILKKGWPSKPVFASLVLIVVGCIVASAADLQFDTVSYKEGILCTYNNCYDLKMIGELSF